VRDFSVEGWRQDYATLATGTSEEQAVFDAGLWLAPKLEALAYVSKPARLPVSGVYLFSEGNAPLYVGRTNHLSQRLGNHCRAGSKANQSSFAFRLAREAAGITEAAYSGDETRQALMMRPDFVAGFAAAKARLNQMQIRFVEERDQVQQALLEIYCAVALKTPYNQFGTH
jgi:hypothetical protein